MTLGLPLSDNKHATTVSVYAPTMTYPGEAKDKLYYDLEYVISATPRTEKLILVGDFNARALKTIYDPKSSLLTDKQVQVGNDQEMVQSEIEYHSKKRGGKKIKLNRLSAHFKIVLTAEAINKLPHID